LHRRRRGFSIVRVTDAIVLGADCGGTSTRVVAATADGQVLGRGRDGPGNPQARPPADAAAALAAAAASALSGLDRGAVVGAVVGVAGVARIAEPDAAAAYAAAWRDAGLTCPMRPVADVVVAFVGGTPEPSGTILIAGTGAIAAEIVDRKVARRVDGLGWLLGDEGSGFWLGLAAARHTARALYAGPALGSLAASVVDAVGADEPAVFVTRFYALPRDRIAALAPLVVAAARAGDPPAVALMDEAADRLAGTLVALHPRPGPVVLAGGLLCEVPELSDGVQKRLEARIGRRGRVASDAAAAAAWLAIRDFAGRSPAEVAATHARLMP
jgi:N-acetylglucosamine kinase-like BadF-type ATPase